MLPASPSTATLRPRPWRPGTGPRFPITVAAAGGAISSLAPSSWLPASIPTQAASPASSIMGLPEMSPSADAALATILLYGFNFTGASEITFGGVPATQFTVTSNTVITATVPAAARTGPVVVTAPGGTATSRAPSRSFPRPAGPGPRRAGHRNPGATVTLTGTGLLPSPRSPSTVWPRRPSP